MEKQTVNLFERVKAVVASELSVKSEEVVLEASLQEDLGADSLDVVELILAVEDEFGITIPDDDVNGIRSVKDIVDYLAEKLS